MPPNPNTQTENGNLIHLSQLAKLFSKGNKKDVATYINSDVRDINAPLTGGTPLRPVAWTPLIFACRGLNYDVIPLLLEKGADPNYSVNGGLTPLLAVVMSATDSNHSLLLEIAKLLVNAGSSVTSTSLSQLRTLLTHTVNKNVLSLLDYFLECGADPHLRDGYGTTALNLAVGKNLDDLVQTLRKRNVNPFLEDLDGQSCVDIAIANKNTEMEEMLKEWRKDYFKKNFGKDKDGFLDMVKSVNVESFKLLAEKSKKSNMKTKPLKAKRRLPLNELTVSEHCLSKDEVKEVKKFEAVGSVMLSKSDVSKICLPKEIRNGVEPEEELVPLIYRNAPRRNLSPSSDYSFLGDTDDDDDFSSEPSTPPYSYLEELEESDDKKEEKPSQKPLTQVILIIGTVLMTIVSWHIARKFKN